MGSEILNGTQKIQEPKVKPVKYDKPPRLRIQRQLSVDEISGLSSKRCGYPTIFALANMKLQFQ